MTSYSAILELFWDGGCCTQKRSKQYQSAIWCHTADHLDMALRSKADRQTQEDRKVVTLVEMAGPFYNAESYHQKFMLRRQSVVLDALALASDEEMVDSHVAARLNGYCSGNGCEDDLLEEWDSFGIQNELALDRLLELCRDGLSGS